MYLTWWQILALFLLGFSAPFYGIYLICEQVIIYINLKTQQNFNLYQIYCLIRRNIKIKNHDLLNKIIEIEIKY